MLVFNLRASSSQDLNDELYNTPGLPTVTVRGFLNFKTTVDGTVIVFTPASDVQHPATQQKIEKTNSEILHSSASPNTAFISKDEFKEKQLNEGVQDISYASPPQNSLENIKTELPNLNLLENKMKQPFLQHISDNAVVPSTGHINNDLDKVKKNQASLNQYPTGLVTVLGGTFVDGASTTIYETKVIGTYIDGKYAQILQSTSHVVSQPNVYMTTSPTLSYSVTDLSPINGKLFSSSISKSILPHSFSIVEINSRIVPSKSSTSGIPSKSPLPNLPTKSSHSQIQPKSLTASISSKSLIPNSSTKSFTIISTPTLNTPEIIKSISSEEKMKQFVQKTNLSPTPEVTKSRNVASFSSVKHKSFQTSLESSFITKSVTVSFDNEQPTESLESVTRNTFTKAESSFMPIMSTVLRFPEDDNTFSATQKNSRNNTSRTRFFSPRRPSQSVSKRKKIKKILLKRSTLID